MKAFYTVLTIVFFNISYCFNQNNELSFNEKKQLLKEQFQIIDTDHRGFVVYFTENTNIQYPIQATKNTLVEAFEFYFSGGIMKDLVVIQINQSQSLNANFLGGTPIDMNTALEKYVELFNQ